MKFITSLSLFAFLSLTVPLSAHPISPGEIASREPQPQVDWQKVDYGNKRGIAGRDPQVDWTPVIYDKRDDQIHDRPVHGPGGAGPLPPRDGGEGSVVSGRDAEPQVKWEPVAYNKRGDE